MKKLVISMLLATAGITASADAIAAPASAVATQAAAATVHYRSATIDGVKMFYREAGPADGPVVLLLHGFPTSSHMFRNLIPLLADRYHVIAPDYPGFGQSDAPDHRQFTYSFAHYADMVDTLMGKIGARRYAMYLMDYGAPVGYRLALKHPERVSGLIVQNGNAYEEGLGAFWDPIKTYWQSGSAKDREAQAWLVGLDATNSNIPMACATCRGSAPTIGCRTRPCSTGRATRISSSTCSTIIAPMCRSTRRSRPFSANASRRR